MPRPTTITRAELLCVQTLVDTYKQRGPQVRLFRDQFLAALTTAQPLSKHVHSIRSRLKDPEHLRDKLIRRLISRKSNGRPFDVTAGNLLTKINDLVGVRILHLYTRQIQQIDRALREIFDENQYNLVEGPFARSWDDESRNLFRGLGIRTQDSPSMYTSVHYVIGSASRTRVTAEVQVRTLMEEVWGEVDHALNYPYKTDSLPCSEELKVLARVTSSATRLVDAIFLTMEHHLSGSASSAGSPAATRTDTDARGITPLRKRRHRVADRSQRLTNQRTRTAPS